MARCWDVAPAPSPSPRVALVTGASDGGIGCALCVQLLALNARHNRTLWVVYGACRRPEATMGVAAGAGARPLAFDVTDAAAVARAVARVEAEAGGIDLLVNNAGCGVGRKPLPFFPFLSRILKNYLLLPQRRLFGPGARGVRAIIRRLLRNERVRSGVGDSSHRAGHGAPTARYHRECRIRNWCPAAALCTAVWRFKGCVKSQMCKACSFLMHRVPKPL